MSSHYPRTWDSAHDKVETFFKKLKAVPKDKWFRISCNGKNLVANKYEMNKGNIEISRDDMGLMAIIGDINIDLFEFIEEVKHENKIST